MIRAQIASLPDRVDSLKMTVESLLPYVDVLVVGLNSYLEVPDFLFDNKIKSDLLDNSLGDAAKFIGVEDWHGYFFSCDDDIVYPDDYVSKMIAAINEYHCIVTLHGKVFKSRPVHSYYHGATSTFRCLGEVMKDVEVDVAGTGVCAFHTDDFKLRLADFEKPNMADLWLSKRAHEQGVKMMCLSHRIGYLGYNHPVNNIYDSNHRNEAFQTQLINSFLK